MGFFRPRIAIPTPTANDLPYNRRCWKEYAEAVSQAGGEPFEVPLTPGSQALPGLLEECWGVCLPGSPADVDPIRYGADRLQASAPADPARETVDFLLLDWAASRRTPVLAICFGLQSLNVWRGGTLVQDVPSAHVNHSAGAEVTVAHQVLVSGDTLLATLADPAEAPEAGGRLRLPVNSSHHQAVAEPGEGLRVVATCPEDGVVEALELVPAENGKDRAATLPPWLLGVQWHPERSISTSALSRALFRELVREAEQARERHRRVGR